MIIVNLKRILRAGLISFWRNGYVSLASVLVMTITLFVVGSLVFNNALLESSLTELKQKVDVNVYFVTTAPEKDVLDLKKKVESFPEVATVSYTSREQALTNFKTRHANDELTLQALNELNDNPLGAVLSIVAKEPSQYESVSNYLKNTNILSKEGKPIIDKVNYNQNKEAINRLTTIIKASEKSNFAKTIILIIVALLVTFNTIRLAIYISKEEISVMRLVGASYKYIRGPFLIVGLFYGIIAGVLAIAIFYPVTYWFGPLFYPFPVFLGDGVGNLALFDYYIHNFLQISLIVLGSGILLGLLSSYLAVRRYLKV